MKFALSTNWCNRRIESGEEIADKAMELGFKELELGFHTTQEQVKGFKARLDRIPVGSVHAFCPVPISAPQGYPELYLLADFDEEARKMAQLQIRRNVKFAAEMGAKTVVLHAGRVRADGLFSRWWGSDLKRRIARGRKMIGILKRELDALVPELEKNKVTLGLENLPYLEGFPAEWEIGEVVSEWVRPWLDTGHDLVRKLRRWPSDAAEMMSTDSLPFVQPIGLHLSDSQGADDHLAPGEGRVDFAELKSVARGARHLVFEPNAGVTEEDLKKGLAFIKEMWAT